MEFLASLSCFLFATLSGLVVGLAISLAIDKVKFIDGDIT